MQSYKLWPIGEKEQINKLSKEVKAVRIYEDAMFSAYSSFVKILKAAVKTSRVLIKKNKTILDPYVKKTSMRLLDLAVVRSVAELLRDRPDFNFRDSLINSLVPRLNDRFNIKHFIKIRM